MTWQDDFRAMVARASVLKSDPSLSDEQRPATMMSEFNIGEMEAWQHIDWQSDEVILDGQGNRILP